MISFSLLLLSVSIFKLCQGQKAVFAHNIVGNTYSYSESDWASDISAAQGAGLDGFALNIAYTDTTSGITGPQLDNAFNAADSAGFKLFISFDYLAQGPWDAQTVISTLQEYTSHGSYYQYNGEPLASTFEGPANAGDWGNIKAQTGCFFMPDYSSVGASAAAAEPNVDGLFSWDAWPNGANDMNTDDDFSYMSTGLPYMMPVSPWFYTNLNEPSYQKNWLWRGDDLWHQRWEQVLQVQPALVEVLTWNDYGESHYIGPLPPDISAIPPSGQWYVQNNPHNAWLADLPYYIAAYKGSGSGGSNHLTVWYRLNPGGACSDDGTTCNTATQGQTTTVPGDCDVDSVFFTAFVPGTATASVTVSIGGQSQTVTATAPGVFHSSVPFNGNTGAVSVQASANNGTIGTVNGPDITTSCDNGNVNWNAWVGGSG